MKFVDFSTEMLVSLIEKLLTKRNAKLAFLFLRDGPDTPAECLSAMIDHVIKHGDRNVRTGAFELSTLQFLMIDIFPR